MFMCNTNLGTHIGLLLYDLSPEMYQYRAHRHRSNVAKGAVTLPRRQERKKLIEDVRCAIL